MTTATKPTVKKTTAAKKAAPPEAAPPPADPVDAVPIELVFPNPGELVIGANVRVDTKLDPDFVDSIRERGVLEPIVAYRDDATALVVLRGQRRTVGALQAGRATVPVVVVPRPDDIDRVTDQILENDQREALAAAERAAGYEQLAAFGLPADQIAKRTKSRREDVDRALAVARSQTVRAFAERHSALGFDQYAAIAEFEDDPAALAELEKAAERGRGFAHVAQSLRDTKDQRDKRAAAEQALTDAGVKVIEAVHRHPKAIRLVQLKGEHGDDATMGVDEHAACPGHAAYVDEDWLYPGDEGYPDPDADPDAEGAEVFAAVPVYVCLDWAKHGHPTVSPVYSPGSTRPAADKSDEERAAAAAERRRVIDGNKAWDSAQKVRRDWIKALLTRKTAPHGAAAFIAGSIARRDSAISHMLQNNIDLARELFGLQPEGNRWGTGYETWLKRRREMTDLAEQASDGRALVIALGLTLAAYEQAADRNSWRHGSATSYDGSEREVTRYLRFLQSTGYELSEIELQACGEHPLDHDQ